MRRLMWFCALVPIVGVFVVEVCMRREYRRLMRDVRTAAAGRRWGA